MKHSATSIRALAAVLALAAAPSAFAQVGQTASWTLTAESVGESVVTLTWPVPTISSGYADNFAYDVRYRVGPAVPPANWSTGPGWNAAETVNCGGEPVFDPTQTTASCTVGGLLPWTYYYFAVQVPYARGTTFMYGEVSVRTLPPDSIAPGTPVLLSATASGTTVHVVWNAVEEDAGDPASGPVQENTIAFVPDGQGIDINNQTFDTLAHVEAGISGYPGTETGHFITGLQPHTLYRVALRAADGSGNNSPVSANLLVMTGDESSSGGDASAASCGFAAGAGSLAWLLLMAATATIGGWRAR